MLLLLLSATAQAAKVVNIGIVTDGPAEQLGWSPELFKKELQALMKGEFEVRFPAGKQLHGGWSAERIDAALKRLQQDPAVNMVLALGYVSSPLAGLGKPPRKPTFAPLVVDAELLGLPRRGQTSGVKNLNYLSNESNFIRDLEAFRKLVDFRNLAVLIDQTSFDALPSLIERARQVAAEAGIRLQFVLQTVQDEDLAKKIAVETEAVVVTSLPRLSDAGMQRLIAALIERHLPSYSLLGSHLVERGLLLSEAPASDWRRLARRNALNMRAVLLGESAGNQPVAFKSERRLTLNMATARAIDLSPRFDVLNQALLLHEEPVAPSGEPLTLAAAALEAVRVNLDLRAAALGVEAGDKAVDEARAALRPQINAGVNYAQRKDDSVPVTSGAIAERSTQAAVTLDQLIYSDKVLAKVEIEGQLQKSRSAEYRQLELDIIQEATTGYLDLLKAQTFVRIRREQLNLTLANLERARNRRRVGVAGPAEVYRWESELATSRKELLAAQASLQQTRDALNRILHRPLKERFVTKPTTLDDPSLLISRKELFDLVDNPYSYDLLGDFLVQEGLAAAPELASVEALMAASKRELRTNRRAYWSPTVSLQGELSNVLEENHRSGLSAEDENDWRVGLNLSLPLFEGGARKARTSAARLELEQRRTQRDATRERIEQGIRTPLHSIRASFPSIQLSRSAASAARKNLNLVADAYARGANSILDLLDAQNAALVADETAANAVFDFLTDLMKLQRSTGQFDFFLDDPARDEWFERLKSYIATGAS